MRILCLLFLFLVSCKGDNPSQVASEIINKFGATCSGNGRWAQQALSQTQALIQIIESLKTKDQCKKFGSFLDHLLQTTRQIHGAYQDTTFLDYRQTQEELQELFLSLQKAEQLQDADLVAQLKVEILSRQALLASLRAQHTVYKEGLDRVGFQDQFSVTTENVASYFATLFNQSGELAACLQQSPSSVIGLFSSLASVGGSFASPGFGKPFAGFIGNV
ncbi:MAG: hypothetical protein D6797_02780 [Bdellovibrio sp.]|nr:MAG: hypothetical protein D6797_02780 [Bdellovibrio sp.]